MEKTSSPRKFSNEEAVVTVTIPVHITPVCENTPTTGEGKVVS